MRLLKLLAISILLLIMSVPANADILSLYEWAVNIDGTVSDFAPPPGFPAGVNVASFNQTTGIGTVGITVTGAGPHKVLTYFDIEIDEATNTFFNEYGSVSVGAPPAGLSWEIDEPGFVFGDIFTDFTAGALDNSNGVPAGSPDDVAVALGWDFILAADETAHLNFVVGRTAPVGFYLQHNDPASSADVFYSTNLDIRGTTPDVPEPSSIVLLATVAAGLGFARFRKARI